MNPTGEPNAKPKCKKDVRNLQYSYFCMTDCKSNTKWNTFISPKNVAILTKKQAVPKNRVTGGV